MMFGWRFVRAERAIAALMLLLAAAPARGQQTRDGQIAAEQAAKAAELHPYVATPAENWIGRFDHLLSGPPPTYSVYFGSVFPGGGFAVGPGYRRQYSDTGVFTAHGAWSVANDRGADAVLTLPEIAQNHVQTSLSASWLKAPGVEFFGIGQESLAGNRSTFFYRGVALGGSARIEASRLLAVSGTVEYFDINTGPTDDQSIETRFTPEEVPGLGADVSYIRSRAGLRLDSREAPGYTTSGGLYSVEWSNYEALHDVPFTFSRIDAEVNQFVPLFRANQVIALRALASATDAGAGNDVPHFLLPDLGGTRVLRGYPFWRFRDRSRLLVTTEYRWAAGRFVDMALFMDAGKVAPRAQDLDLQDLNYSYGVGIRLHSPSATVMRLEAAHTREGIGLLFAFGAAF